MVVRRRFRSISMMGFGGSSPGGDASSFSFNFNDGFRKMLGRLPVVMRLQLVRVDGVRRRFRSISMMGFGKCWVVSRW
jgi:hypothetical protein|uniref:Uncharacterized protein n=1 Tax=Fagus sylvatica TaxID=28930 RepID=A0A2N9FE84_FAGSY